MSTDVANWQEVQNVIRTRFLAIRVKSLMLVSWVRTRMAALEQAMLPGIEQVEELERDSRSVRVTIAGSERLVTLQGAEARLLRDLAREGTAESNRKTKSQILAKIPELRGLIHPIRSRTSDRALFGMEQRLRERVNLAE